MCVVNLWCCQFPNFPSNFPHPFFVFGGAETGEKKGKKGVKEREREEPPRGEKKKKRGDEISFFIACRHTFVLFLCFIQYSTERDRERLNR